MYLFILRESHAHVGEGPKERTRSPSRLRAVGPEPDVGLDLKNWEVMTRAAIRRMLND